VTESADAVLTYWSEHRQQIPRSESPRAVLTNYIPVIVATVSGFLVQRQLRPTTLPLSILATVINGYGAAMAAKYHERANHHLTKARALTTTLVDLGALPENTAAPDAARTTHNLKYPRLHRIRLHAPWIRLHLLIMYGLILTAVTLSR
jgi:hypothetical protein